MSKVYADNSDKFGMRLILEMYKSKEDIPEEEFLNIVTQQMEYVTKEDILLDRNYTIICAMDRGHTVIVKKILEKTYNIKNDEHLYFNSLLTSDNDDNIFEEILLILLENKVDIDRYHKYIGKYSNNYLNMRLIRYVGYVPSGKQFLSRIGCTYDGIVYRRYISSMDLEYNIPPVLYAIFLRKFSYADILLINGAYIPEYITYNDSTIHTVELLAKSAKYEYDKMYYMLMYVFDKDPNIIISYITDREDTYNLNLYLLQLAIILGNIEIFNLILEKDIAVDNPKISLLHDISESNLDIEISIEMCESLVNKYYMTTDYEYVRLYNISRPSNYIKCTPLTSAILAGNYEFADYLIGLGEKIPHIISVSNLGKHFSNNKNKELNYCWDDDLLLLYASYRGVEHVRYLINKGIDVNIKHPILKTNTLLQFANTCELTDYLASIEVDTLLHHEKQKTIDNIIGEYNVEKLSDSNLETLLLLYKHTKDFNQYVTVLIIHNMKIRGMNDKKGNILLDMEKKIKKIVAKKKKLCVDMNISLGTLCNMIIE